MPDTETETYTLTLDCECSIRPESPYWECAWNCAHCNDESFCEQCWNDHAQYYCQHCDGSFCCIECGCPCGARGGIGGLNDYSYKPRPQFFGTGPTFFGMELEITADSGDVSAIDDWAARNGARGLFYCKEDSSVAGFEIVTHPMGRDFFDSVDWDSFFNMLGNEWPCEEESYEHGLHVHVSREGFRSLSALARWSYLLNRNFDHVARMARRRSDEWAAQCRTPVRHVMADEWVQRKFGAHTKHEFDRWGDRRSVWTRYGQKLNHQAARGYLPRYTAVNLNNGATVELRVFKSTRSADTLRQTIHMIDESVRFAHATMTRNLSWDAFTEHVGTTGDMELLAFVAGTERG